MASARPGPKQFSAPMPEILFVLDNDFEQRYYRSPETAARGMGWLARDYGQVVAYRRIDEGGPNMAQVRKIMTDAEADFAKKYPRGWQPGISQADFQKDSQAMDKRVREELAKLFAQVR